MFSHWVTQTLMGKDIKEFKLEVRTLERGECQQVQREVNKEGTSSYSSNGNACSTVNLEFNTHRNRLSCIKSENQTVKKDIYEIRGIS
jgi:hypothetical protein